MTDDWLGMKPARPPNPRPILHAIRELLKFHGSTTLAEIASIAEVKKSVVLETLNRNRELLAKGPKTGRIVAVDPQGVLRKQLFSGGAFFYARDRSDNQSMRSLNEGYLHFEGHDDLRKELTVVKPNSYGVDRIVPDTPENRARLVAVGCVPWTEIVIDDRLWIEGSA